MRLPLRLPDLSKFKPTLKSIPEYGPVRPPRNPTREEGKLAAGTRKPMGLENQRFVPPTRPGPQGHPGISWPSAPIDAKGRLRSTRYTWRSRNCGCRSTWMPGASMPR